MHGLIGELFLRRFLGSRSYRSKGKLADEATTLPENEGKHPPEENPAEQGCLPREDLPKKEARLEIKKTGEINKYEGPNNGSDQPASDIQPPTSDEKKE